jgi:hypothetical protein
MYLCWCWITWRASQDGAGLLSYVFVPKSQRRRCVATLRRPDLVFFGVTGGNHLQEPGVPDDSLSQELLQARPRQI